jgi:hypothetical protein
LYLQSLTLVSASVIGLATCVITHLASARLTRRLNPYPCLALGTIVGVATTVAITLIACSYAPATNPDTAALVVMNVVAISAFAFKYFCFVNLAITSLRIRMLGELAQAGGCLPRTALLAHYDTADVIALRIQRLVQGGHLVVRDERFFSGLLHFLVLARFFDCLRWAIVGPRHPVFHDAPRTSRAVNGSLKQ